MIPFFNMTVYATMKVTPPDSTPYETGDRQECRLALVGDSQRIDRDLTFKPAIAIVIGAVSISMKRSLGPIPTFRMQGGSNRRYAGPWRCACKGDFDRPGCPAPSRSSVAGFRSIPRCPRSG